MRILSPINGTSRYRPLIMHLERSTISRAMMPTTFNIIHRRDWGKCPGGMVVYDILVLTLNIIYRRGWGKLTTGMVVLC